MKVMRATAKRPWPAHMRMSGAMATMGDGLEQDRVRQEHAAEEGGSCEYQGDQ